ncbi:MAG: DNA polymerase I [Longimicrobiales bacterium]
MDVPKKTAPRLFLIDAYALIYRSFFAFINRPLTNARGENTSAPFGFVNFLFSIREEFEPDYIGVVFDAGRSHREEVYPDYKATRAKMPDELRSSLPKIRELVEAFGDKIIAVDGWEADDVIGTLACRAREAGLEAVIVSGDKDFYQLVGDGVHLLNPGRGGPSGVAADWVVEANASDKFGVPPNRVIDYLALVGDSSDNVPGAPGIGPKTALKLLQEYDTVEGVLDHASDIKGKRARESLTDNRDDVLLSKELVTIRTDMDLDQDLEELKVSAPDRDRLRELFVELEFRTLLDRVAPEKGNGEGPAVVGAVKTSYEIVTDAARLAEIAAECRDSGEMGVAFLNRTLQSVRGKLAGLAVSPSEGTGYYLPVGHESALTLALGDVEDGRPPNLPELTNSAWAELLAAFADPGIVKVGHDLKATMIAAKRADVELAGEFKDVMVASYVLDPGRRHQDLGALATDFLGFELVPVGGVLGTGKQRQAYGDVSADKAVDYACQRAEVPLRLWARFQQGLEAQELQGLFDEVETPLIPVLAAMEMAGIEIDPVFFSEMSGRLEKPLADLQTRIHEAAGMEFNINSVPQLREVLFERLELPVKKKTKTGPSTDASVLEELAAEGHELPALLTEYRELEKLRNTYVDALPTLINSETGRLHTTFNQAVAATGRLSSSEPNLQNIPIRTEIGREIRKGFVAREGAVLLAADYSQIELRVLAHFSGDEVFVRAFKEDKDVHRETAAVIFEVPVDDVTAKMRGQAKTVNFATLYGQGAFSLAQQLGISRDEAKDFIEQYFERFSGVRRFLDEEVEKAKKRGYVDTLMGRRRYVPELHSKNWNVRNFGERVAQNTPIQGTAADLIKVAMIRVDEALGRREGVDMLLQVHDELVLEVDEGQLEEVEKIVVSEMESAMDLNVPIRVDSGWAKTWFDAKG